MDRNFYTVQVIIVVMRSLSARRAWIEIMRFLLFRLVAGSSLSARRAWIEIDSAVDSASGTLSLSARRAWIEIPTL